MVPHSNPIVWLRVQLVTTYDPELYFRVHRDLIILSAASSIIRDKLVFYCTNDTGQYI